MSTTITLKSLFQTIETKIKNGSGTIDLVPDVLSTDAIGKFYKDLIPSNIFEITAAALQPSAWDDKLKAFTLTGDSDSFGLGEMSVSMVFSNTEAGVLSDLTLTLAEASWSLDGVDWFGLSNPFVGIQVYYGGLPVVGTIGGSIQLSPIVDLTLQMTYPVVEDVWLMQGKLEAPYPSLSNFYQLMGGVNLSAALPQPFSTLTDLGLQEIDVKYDSKAQEISYISTTIGTSDTYEWQILPKLAVSNIGINCVVQQPGDSKKRKTAFTITGSFTIGAKDANNLVVTATVPNFTASVQLESGTIQLGDLITMFWDGAEVDLKSEITTFDLEIEPTAKNYSLNAGVKSDWIFLKLPVANVNFTMTGMNLEVASQQGNNSGRFTGLFNIGANSDSNGVDISISAGYSDNTWNFFAKTGKDQKIPLVDIAYTFLKPFGIGEIPEWVSNGGVVLDISNVAFNAIIPSSAAGKPNTYKVGGTVLWGLNFSSFNVSLKAVIDITFAGDKSFGKITGTTKLLGLKFEIGYEFSSGKTQEIYLQWEGIRASYTQDIEKKQDIFLVKFTKMSLGDIITKLMNSFIPGFELTSPWSVLNSISLDGLSFTYTKNTVDSTLDTVVITYNSAIDLGFLKIANILLTKDKEGVHLGFEGTFLGLTITAGDETTGKLAGKGSKVNEMPAVPGMGDGAFDLKFVGLGQHIELANSRNFNHVDDAIKAMKDAFKDANDSPNTIPIKAGAGQPLVFNQNSDWLIGADFTVAKFYRMAFVFNDPNLYGLVIGVSDQAQFLKNLQFEILYKKVNDSIGVYQIELQLPDIFRQLQFGAVSVTMPNIGLKIYTNGNFYIDIGWPASVTDFSRSFTLQVFPFMGSGGFYFAALTGVTATGLPRVKKGVFNPVIQAGVALSVGLGKTIEAGILKAGLSLTAIGIFQGTYAPFTPNPNLGSLSNETDTYYKFSGTLALVGRIYGEINFAIISASLDITAYIQISFVIEAYRAIPIVFQAGVSVTLTVKINLGLFKISIGLSFSATITASFIIGQDKLQESLWYKVDHYGQALPRALFLAASTPVTLKWQPIVIDTNETFGLDLYFAPHLTVSGEKLVSSGQNYSPGPQYVGMLYIDTGKVNPGSFTQFGMNALATGALYWAANAIVGSGESGTKLSWLKDQVITRDQIKQLLCYIQTRPNNEAPFNYKNATGNDIASFLRAFFTVQISAIDGTQETDMSASVFPIFPDLQMQTVINTAKGDLVDFATHSMTGNQDYLKDVSNLLKYLSASYETAATAAHYAPSDCANVTDPNYEEQTNLSMPTFIFTDFVAIAVKQLLQNAADYFKVQGTDSMKVSDMVNSVANNDNVSQLGGMASRFMLHGLRLPEPPLATTGQIQPLYVLTGQQWTIPNTIKVTDSYAVNLMNTNASWINFIKPVDGQLQVVIDANDIHRVINLNANTLDPSVISGYPKALNNINNTPQNFSLGGDTVWNYPGDFFTGVATKPTLWKTPPNFRGVLKANTSLTLDFGLQTLTPNGDSTSKGTISNLTWATSLNISLQKITAQDLMNTPLAGNVYNVEGADDASINLLEDILLYMNKEQGGNDNFIEQIQFLMKPDPVSGESGLVSSANGNLNAAIIQANLSTETNPNLRAKKALLEASQYNTLNKPGNFMTLLWECSIVRSGGFYFYYITPEDGKGLPDYLFGETGVANLQVVITYGKFVPRPFVNAVITGDDLDFSKTTVFAQSPDITVAVPSLMPGNVGYELSRNNPGDFDPTQNPPTAAEDQVYLQNQFNLLGVSLPAVPIYKNYLPAGPVNPLTQDDIQAKKEGRLKALDPMVAWNYTSGIPYYKFVQGPYDDPNYPNPYAGIGTNVQMLLNWQDMFGNIPTGGVSSLPVSMPLLYTDKILSVSQWPSVSSFYLFEDNGSGPELTVNFCFDVSRYNDGTEGTLNNAAMDLETYLKLYYQLSSGDMAISFASTIQGTEAVPEGLKQNIAVSDLTTSFVLPIINYLKQIITNVANPDLSKIPMPYYVAVLVDVNSIASYADSIALTLNITMQRTKNVDPNFIDSPGVSTAVTPVKPQAQSKPCGQNQEGSLSLSYFADLFETAFANKPTSGILIKIATASDGDNDNNSDNAGKEVWMVRFDSTGANGIKYSYDNSKVYFYAPVPLATSLVSMDAAIAPYQTGKPYPAGAPIDKKFSSVDLDDWGKQFLEAVDGFLAPGLAVPAFLLDNGKTLKDILEYKKQIADAIEGTIDFIIDPADKTGSNIGNAQEKWKQQMLNELSSAYKYSAAIQTPVAVDSSWIGSNSDPVKGTLATPKLYGNVVGNDTKQRTTEASREYSLSTAKLPMADGPSWLTYMFESKDTAEFRNFEFGNMQFKASHLEQQIRAVDGIEGYMASSWLTFINPLDASLSNVGEIVIPVPLRAYPAPPSITAQTVNYPVEGADMQTLEGARKWNFRYSYKNAIAAQDTIETQVELNIPDSSISNNVLRAPGDIALDEVLAQFTDSYAQLSDDFKTYLAALTQKDVVDNTLTYTKAMYAVVAFKTIIGQVATAWGSWNQINPREPKNASKSKSLMAAQQPIVINFTVIETGTAKTGYLNVQVIPAAGNVLPQVPIVQIPGYQETNIGNNTYQYVDGEGNPLTYEKRNVQPLRNAVLQELDILIMQNAWGAVQVIRNLDLLPDGKGGWQQTNKHFLYQTPMVKFYTKLTAFLSDKTPIDIAKIATGSYPAGNRPIQDNMRALFEAFTNGVEVPSLVIKLSIDYASIIAGTELSVKVPVLLLPPMNLDVTDKGASFANDLAAALTDWLASNIPGTPDGKFEFSIDVFSSLDPNALIFQAFLFLDL